jgi:hypothetical protein
MARRGQNMLWTKRKIIPINSQLRSRVYIFEGYTFYKLSKSVMAPRPISTAYFIHPKSKSCYDWRSVSQSVCLGVKFTLELVTLYYSLSESCCVVSVGRPLWWEVGSVSCQSLSSVFSPLSNCQRNKVNSSSQKNFINFPKPLWEFNPFAKQNVTVTFSDGIMFWEPHYPRGSQGREGLQNLDSFFF